MSAAPDYRGLLQEAIHGDDEIGDDEIGAEYDVMADDELAYDEVAYDVGAIDVGYDVGYDVSGIEVGAARRPARGRRILVPRGRKTIMRPRMSVLGRPMPPRPQAIRTRPVDRYDAAYQGATREHGQGLPQMTMAFVEVQLAVAGAFLLLANAPQSFILTTLTVNANAANFLSNVTFLIGGTPVGSFAGFLDLSRFVAGSFDKRLPPQEVPAGSPIQITGVVNAGGPAAPNNFYRIEVVGSPLRMALSQASV